MFTKKLIKNKIPNKNHSFYKSENNKIRDVNFPISALFIKMMLQKNEDEEMKIKKL